MAIAILSLGIGASTAAFSIVNTIFFRTLPVPEPDRLAYIYSLTEQARRYPSFGENWMARLDAGLESVFSGITAHSHISGMVAVDDESSHATGEVVTANYFDVLGVTPAQGRGFEPKEDDPGNASLAVVISDSLWDRRFQRDPNVLGRSLRIDDQMYAVIGVTPSGFDGLTNIWYPSQFWITRAQRDASRGRASRPQSYLGAVVRLRAGVPLQQAQAAINVIAPQLQEEAMRELPARNWRPRPHVVSPAQSVSDPYNPDGWTVSPQILSGIAVVVGIVLAIAATNIAGVLAARSVTRAQEVAVRQALGAGARQLLRQLLTESVLLALAGGALGLLVAWIIAQVYQATWSERFEVEATFNLRVVGFTAGICLVAGVLVGLVPALQAARVNVVSALSSGAATGRGGRTRSRLRHAIVVPQVALSIVLLIVAGVHVRTLWSFEGADLGYNIENVVTLRPGHWDVVRPMTDWSTQAREAREARDRAYARALTDTLRGVPGDIAITSHLPIWGPSGMQGRFTTRTSYLAGSPVDARADAAHVSPGFFKTMGLPLLEGRDFDDRDGLAMPAVAIVSESFAQRLWPGRSAIGESFAWYFPDQKEQPWWLQVVGIAGDTDPVLEPGGNRPMVYTALSQAMRPFMQIVARHHGDAAPLIEQIKRAVMSADSFSQVSGVKSLTQAADEILFPRRAAAGILLAGGAAGLLLACIGIYGVISHSVAQRLQEIGIRATLGADRRDILVLVLREAVTVSGWGALPGIGLAILALRLTSATVGAVPVFDAGTFLVVSSGVLAVILAASYLPARRASRLDPMTVLRGL